MCSCNCAAIEAEVAEPAETGEGLDHSTSGATEGASSGGEAVSVPAEVEVHVATVGSSIELTAKPSVAAKPSAAKRKTTSASVASAAVVSEPAREPPAIPPIPPIPAYSEEAPSPSAASEGESASVEGAAMLSEGSTRQRQSTAAGKAKRKKTVVKEPADQSDASAAAHVEMSQI